MNQYETGNSGGGGMSFLFGAVVGALAGAGVALLLAPKSGAELRNDLSESMGTLKETASRKVRDVKDRASSSWNDMQSSGSTGKSSTSTGSTGASGNPASRPV
jgi:gas vesicle protein